MEKPAALREVYGLTRTPENPQAPHQPFSSLLRTFATACFQASLGGAMGSSGAIAVGEAIGVVADWPVCGPLASAVGNAEQNYDD